MERLWAAVLLVLICIGRNVDGANTENFYFKVGRGDSVTLRPPSGSDTTITGVTWRHGENIAAEWSKGEPVELYLAFKGRTDLNTTTGVMVIRDMTEQQAGEYSVEINNRRLEDKYVVTAVEKPPKPNVWPKVGTTEDQLELKCEWTVTEKAQPVTYWWKTDGPYVERDQKIVVAKSETVQGVKEFFCKIVNIAGEAESNPWLNTFYQEVDYSALGALAIIPILLAGIGIGYWQRAAIKQRLCPGSGDAAEKNVASQGMKRINPEEATRNTTAESTAGQSEPLYANETT